MASILKDDKKQAVKELANVMKHNCKLPQEEDILVKYIDSGYFVDFRRSFRGWLMVSATNPRSKIYLKSSCAIRREKERHLQEFYYMIHPFSQMRYCWEIMMICFLIIILTTIPIQLCFDVTVLGIVVRLALDGICFADIIVTFNTGYQNRNTKKIVMKRMKVATHYLTSWLALDLITSINIEGVLHATRSIGLQYLIYTRSVNFLKVLKIINLVRYMNSFRDYKQYSIYKFTMFKMVLIFFLLLLWTTCFLYVFERASGSTKTLLEYFYQTSNLFLIISISSNSSLFIMICEMVTLTAGIILQLFFFAQLLQTVMKYNTSKTKYHEMYQQLCDYMDTKDLPPRMKNRVIKYFDFRFQKNYFKEDEILGTLSNKLVDEINLQSCQSLIANVNIFKNMPTSVIMKMTSMMKQEIFLPNDVIVQAQTYGDCMYFISSGTVAIYTPSGKEICHLTDGSNFGEVCLIMDHSTRVATVVAVDYCDLSTLSRKDFQAAIEPYPQLYQRTVKLARQRMKNVMLSEHFRNRPDEFYDFTTAEGISDFIEKLYEM